MFTRLRYFLFGNRQSEQAQIDGMLKQLQQLKADLGAALPLADLRPVLIPSTILASGDWFGPHHYFRTLPVSLTWAFMRPENSLQYLSRDVAEKLAADGIDWRSTARQALFEDSTRRPWISKRQPDNENAAAAAVLQDELGPSRLLCYDHLLKLFPNGFQLYVPHRWAAYVVASDAPPDVQADITRFVQRAYKEADVPMSLEPHDHLLLKDALITAGEYA
jgi:hypothetical protein